MKRHVHLVISQLSLLLNLIQGLLDLKAVSENNFVPRIERFDPIGLFEEIIELFKI